MNGLASCYISTIGKPHEYFDLTGLPVIITAKIALATFAARKWSVSDFFAKGYVHITNSKQRKHRAMAAFLHT